MNFATEQNLFNDDRISEHITVEVFADEIQHKEYPIFNQNGEKLFSEFWHYIGLLISEKGKNPLERIINERFCYNHDYDSPYHLKNNKIVHYSELDSKDAENIALRWINSLINNSNLGCKFYLLGINETKLNKYEFNTNDEFNSIYNRFFRSAFLYSLKAFYNNQNVLVENIYHEDGQQKDSELFSWHLPFRLNNMAGHIIKFSTSKIEFLPKDHKKDPKSNLIQFCDILMGTVSGIIHGIGEGRSKKYRSKLVKILKPVLVSAMNKEFHTNRFFRVSFFPRQKSEFNDPIREGNNYYHLRTLLYKEENINQGELF